ncbi:MAG TPA: 4Fe-4S binding protein [Roseiflexaceae bacterium]|nr:4Fe-4S binding protein [Roseiflexaceae bacterium]
MAQNLQTHPTVIRFHERDALRAAAPQHNGALDAEWLRQVCLEAGADDVGFVAIDRPELDDQRAEILAAYPRTQALISIVCRMNREPIRSPARSIANLEFHRAGDDADGAAHRIVALLERHGVGALNPAVGFPMEVSRFPGKTWVVSHKPVAVAAGLGQIGIHRNVIHPVFGNFILLSTVLVGAPISQNGQPIDYNPCLECKLCVAACPVGAISSDGAFDFSACFNHNYREFMGGFSDWVGQLVASHSPEDYRRRVSEGETASMWQSLSMGANYKAAYCVAVCPAGEDVIGPFLSDRKTFLAEVVRPLQQKVEPVYVVPDSDAEQHVRRRFPHKQVRPAGTSLRLNSVEAFLTYMHIGFKRHRAAGLDLTYHFTFTGAEPAEATVVIRDGTLHVERGHCGAAQLHITADSQTWVRFLRKETSLVWSLLRRKIRLRGSPLLLRRFGQCFAT